MNTEKKKNKRLKKRMIGTFVMGVIIANLLILCIGFFLSHRHMEQFLNIYGEEFLIRANIFFLHFMITIAAILIILGITLYSRVYTDIISRLNTLSAATVKIANDELDFELAESSHHDEIDDLCRDFEDMRKRLLESSLQRLHDEEENKKLISNITHDLKTPVTSIKGYAEGLLDGVASTAEKQEKYLRTIYSKSEELNRLLNELTYYTSIEQSRIPYNFEKIDVNMFFKDIVDETDLELESINIPLKYETKLPDNTLIIADRAQLHKVINNIIGNSIKYRDKPDTFIQIRLSDLSDSIQLDFEDNGCGIPAQSLPNIFDRFYRSDEARSSSTGGNGIGLSIVKKIIEDHGGRIWASSVLKESTIIHIQLRKYMS